VGRIEGLSAVAAPVVRPVTTQRAAPLVAAALAALTYAPMMGNFYAADDALIVTTSGDRAHAPLSTLFDRSFFDRYNQDTYRPFATFTTMVDYRVGLDPRHAGHLQNMLWHACATALLVIFAGRFLPAAAAFFAGAFFAVHPAATESVLSVGFREDGVVTCLLLASLVLTWPGGLGRRAFALVTYALALFTKENAIVFPVLLVVGRLALDAGRAERRRALVLETSAFALVTLGYLGVRFGLMASEQPFADPLGGTYAATLVGVPRIFAHYLRVLVVPWPLLVSYSHEFPMGGSLVPQLPWLALDLAFLALALRLVRSRPLAGFGLLWFALALAPVLHFVPLRVEAADRFVHLSLVGGALAAGASLVDLDAAASRLGARHAAPVAAAAALLGFVVLTELRIPAWHDDLALWKETLRRNPRAYLAHFGVAEDHLRHGRTAPARAELEAAVASCPRSSAFGRDRFCAYFASRLGFQRLFAGDLPGARAAFLEGLGFKAAYVPALLGLGRVSLAEGDLPRARGRLAEAIGYDPRNPIVRQLADELRAGIEAAGR
jgi:hypothetical protein